MVAVKLKQLIQQIKDVEIRGSKDVDILQIVNNSKAVGPGSMFIAKRGTTFDGNMFVPEAVRAGASCIVSDTFDPSLKSVTQLVTKNVAMTEIALAHAFWQNPSLTLPVLGITGTSGKTTISYLLRHLLQSLGLPCGLMGTIEYAYGEVQYEASRTTPDILTVVKMLSHMKQAKMKACVMEVTSHACMQKRVGGVHFQGGIFTNLSHDHLDYHMTMDEYAKAKKLFFQQLEKEGSHIVTAPFAVVNRDDPVSAFMVKDFSGPVFSYSLQDPSADFFADNVSFSDTKMTFTMHALGKKYLLETYLVGRFNVMNILASMATLFAMKLDVVEGIRGLSTFYGAPGRLQRVPNDLGITVVVDYSHKEDALQKVLTTLKEVTRGNIITLFGCGGDRDRAKRPRMAAIAERFSEKVVVTSDNPRSEDPRAIISEICSGFETKNWTAIEDRKEAIFHACTCAKPGDVVLLAGKGHEKTQSFAKETVPFDDQAVVFQVCQMLANTKES